MNKIVQDVPESKGWKVSSIMNTKDPHGMEEGQVTHTRDQRPPTVSGFLIKETNLGSPKIMKSCCQTSERLFPVEIIHPAKLPGSVSMAEITLTLRSQRACTTEDAGPGNRQISEGKRCSWVQAYTGVGPAGDQQPLEEGHQENHGAGRSGVTDLHQRFSWGSLGTPRAELVIDKWKTKQTEKQHNYFQLENKMLPKKVNIINHSVQFSRTM